MANDESNQRKVKVFPRIRMASSNVKAESCFSSFITKNTNEQTNPPQHTGLQKEHLRQGSATFYYASHSL